MSRYQREVVLSMMGTTPLARTLAGRVLASLAVMGGAVAIALFGSVATVAFYVSYAATGLILALRRPGNAVGPLLIGIGWAIALGTLTVDGDPAALVAGSGPLVDRIVAWGAAWGWQASMVLLFTMTLVFPSGRLASRYRRWGIGAIAVAVVSVVLLASAPTITVAPSQGPPVLLRNPMALFPESALWRWRPSEGFLFAVPVILVVVGVSTLFARYRGAGGVERLQLRWAVSSLVLAGLGSAFGFAVASALGSAAENPMIAGNPLLILGWVPGSLGLLAVPISIGVAVLRYRLYEIDRIVSRTVSYTALAVVVVAVYAVPVVAVPALVGASSDLVVAASTLAAAAIFAPARRSIQASVDRRFNRSRFDHQREVEAFSERLRSWSSTDDVSRSLRDIVGRTMQPATATLWIRDLGGPRPA